MLDVRLLDKIRLARKSFICLVIICFSSFVVLANGEQIESLFRQGNDAYKKGEYAKAVEAYNSIYSLEYQSYSLYFNMGNAYYKLHEYGRAMLAYERCLKQYNSSDELENNIALCKQNLLDKDTPAFSFSIGSKLINLFSEKQWAWLSIGFMLLLMLPLFMLFYVKVNTKKIWFNMTLLIAFFLITTLVLGGIKKYSLTSNKEAIVLSQTMRAYAEPSPEAKEVFVLHEGTKIYIIRQEGEWINFSVSNGNEGWCLLQGVEEI